MGIARMRSMLPAALPFVICAVAAMGAAIKAGEDYDSLLKERDEKLDALEQKHATLVNENAAKTDAVASLSKPLRKAINEELYGPKTCIGSERDGACEPLSLVEEGEGVQTGVGFGHCNYGWGTFAWLGNP